MRSTLLLFASASILLCSCLDEEELSVDALYSEELVEEFTIFDPCDTITAPNYRVTRASLIGDKIERLFHMTYPAGEILFLGRSLPNNIDYNKQQLFYQGMTILDRHNDSPTFVLFEDKTGVIGFDNVFLIGQENAFETDYFLCTSSDALSAAIFNDGDLFKVNLYEIQERDGSITISKALVLNATSGASQRAQYDYRETAPPVTNSQEFNDIENFITLMKSGTYPFDPSAQVKKFDLQLGLHQRDFKFAQGLIEEDFLNILSEENQKAIRAIATFSNVRAISALDCLTDQEEWSISDPLAADIPSPLD